MKTIIITIVIALSCIHLNSQEFKTHSNGLIYDANTIHQLKFIVDSLNLKFKACEMTETYYATPQTKALVFNLYSGNIKQAKKDLENNMSIDYLKNTYPKAIITKPKLIIAYDDINYDDYETTTHISTKSIGSTFIRIIKLKKTTDVSSSYKKGDWIIDYKAADDYYNESIMAFYLLDDFKKPLFKDIYAEMIQYADCMIDTTSSKMLDTKNFNGNLDEAHNWIETSDFSKLSINEKEELLIKLRQTRVIGTCSMDSSPRIHALNIALLSAETINWEVFLKAHLDVMNDRFERATDGSYAWAARKTYLKELEVLDINLVDLIFGITFRIDNANKNHYYGSLRRLGRALTESKDQVQFEKLMLQMIKDDELDDYNRYVLYYFYDNYLYHLNDCNDKTERKEKFKQVEQQLKQVQKFLPKHLIGSD